VPYVLALSPHLCEKINSYSTNESIKLAICITMKKKEHLKIESLLFTNEVYNEIL